MTTLELLKEHAYTKAINIANDPAYVSLAKRHGLTIHLFSPGIFLLTPIDELKAAPMKMAEELRLRQWFTATVNPRLFVVTHDQAKSNFEAKRMRNQLAGIEEKANNALEPSLQALAKTNNVIISKVGDGWLVKPKGQRASIKLLSRQDKRLTEFAKAIRRYSLYLKSFSTVEKSKFKQYAFIGSDTRKLEDMVSKYSKGNLEVSNLLATDFLGKMEEVKRLGYVYRDAKDGNVLIRKETREFLQPADIMKIRHEMESIALDMHPSAHIAFTIHVANNVSYYMGIAQSIVTALRISRQG